MNSSAVLYAGGHAAQFTALRLDGLARARHQSGGRAEERRHFGRWKTLLGIAAAGYAGADFIENAFTHVIPGMGTTVPMPPAAPPLATPSPPAVADGGGAVVFPPNPPPATVPVRLAVTGVDLNTADCRKPSKTGAPLALRYAATSCAINVSSITPVSGCRIVC
jgi:hypothetical protein